MTDVARRQARSQKQRLDTALLERRRREALADVGETLYELVESGEIELDELPELARALQEVTEIDRRIAEAEEETRRGGQSRMPVRLGRTGSPPRGRREGVWRPPVDPEPEIEPEASAGAQEAQGVDVEFEVRPRGRPSRPPGRERPRQTGQSSPSRRTGRAASSGGGIVFVDDDSAPSETDPDDAIESYMNENDVPRRR